MKVKLVVKLLLCCLVSVSYSQKLAIRQSFYSTESKAEIVVFSESTDNFKVSLKYSGKNVDSRVLEKNQMNYIPFDIKSLKNGEHNIICKVIQKESVIKSDTLKLIKLKHRKNEVKIDLATGSFIVENKPFIPFGFYCYSPVQSTLPEEEVTKGFNTISPYQKIMEDTFYERKRYMDRCAALGMKVHYNLLSVAGGGGVGSGRSSEDSITKDKLLREEVKLFKDHPALLAWYISDEPIGQGVPVKDVERAYKIVKSIDRHHPVSVVFMEPSGARRYADAMDVVMADPYPVPGNINEVSHVIKNLKKEFLLEKPVWLVPQSFGGGENWKREPTAGEIRAMTYMGILNGARAIQYFIRHGLNAFPKSTIAWNECSKIAYEIAEITPYLTSDETPGIAISHTHKTLCRAYRYNNKQIIVLTNTENKPKPVEIETDFSGIKAREIFQKREVNVDKGFINDYISAYGTLVYELTSSENKNNIKIASDNLSINPSFENNFSLGVPSGCYASIGNDRGATYFTDSRVSLHGDHSLRVTTPYRNSGVRLQFFPIDLNKETTYKVSVWAKASELSGSHNEFTLSFGKLKSKKFSLTKSWKRYDLNVIIDSNSKSFKAGAAIEVNSKSTVWFDLLQVTQLPIIEFDHTENGAIVYIKGNNTGEIIRVTLNGKTPTKRSRKYKRPIRLRKSKEVSAAIFSKGKLIAKTRQRVPVHSAIGSKVKYNQLYSKKYSATGKKALVDGVLASISFKDKNWQGFEKEDIDLTIDLGKLKRVSKIDMNFLNDKDAGIYFPKEINIMFSSDGKNFSSVGKIDNSGTPENKPAYTKIFSVKTNVKRARYIKVKASNISTIPEGYKFAGTKAWLFIDEIMVY